MNQHRHSFSSGWIRGRQTFRECVGCRQVFRWYGDNRKPEIMKSDYNYYKEMADQVVESLERYSECLS